MKIILASSSPRRKEILENHSISPIIIPSDAEEIVPSDIEVQGVAEIVKYLAYIKAFTVYNALLAACNENSSNSGTKKSSELCEACELISTGERMIILGADTVVYKDTIIGKPIDEDDAFSILSALRNTSHHVYTGVCLIDFQRGESIKFYEDTLVYFKDYPDEEIRRFIREEPPYDKSGSYAIQSSWSKNVDRVEGDLENVIGLPWKKTEEYLSSI